MAPNPTCRYCGTDPNSGEIVCASEREARQCPWMGESDWKRYDSSVDKARAWDAMAKAVADERKKVVEQCAKIASDRATRLRAKAKAQTSPSKQSYFAQSIEARVIADTILGLLHPVGQALERGK